ncbi:bifunctional 3,4-dihydroxy-2-butanone-4-phosphate synthase/GTP cyclohydrolase II (plasmid) [Rhodococcus oxybenzonivorans]|uniref:GTP cyclohydrolase-2 n=1 Tax=Rhodococcus oxybenzonivorans TaxID=1990687 RepID=A0A2S2C5T9_9NOCA|nr:3,4-dihydroxy-2-butanone-4-phosphate synthase [Rhodococcus oxybenzonivorans]AWK76148.1 bifunctional 3,4-dihydroxy-2-butanone-4-phosphate synthase/GTP cyclohydrolase II [Rhodococcus oxybenzonivorans]
MSTGSAGVPRALAAIAAGSMVVVLDDRDRENEADLIMAAQCVDTDSVAFFLEHTSGFLCTAITESRAGELELPLMVEHNTESMGTAFLDSVDFVHGTSTGISAADRAATIRSLAQTDTKPVDLARPGHVLPLRARAGGVLERPGHTEAGVDLCSAAGVLPAALICELITADKREMLRGSQARAFADRHGLEVITIAEIVAYRTDQLGPPQAEHARARIPTPYGLFNAMAYSGEDGIEHAALVHGDVAGHAEVAVRVHSECLTGDLFGSLRCDCRTQLEQSLRMVTAIGAGVIIYLRGHEGRGIGLGQKLRAYRVQQCEGLDTIDANLAVGSPVDVRDYRAAAAMLTELQVRSIRLITNNPDKITALSTLGVKVCERIASGTEPTAENLDYLRTKRDRLGHLLELPTEEELTDRPLSSSAAWPA